MPLPWLDALTDPSSSKIPLPTHPWRFADGSLFATNGKLFLHLVGLPGDYPEIDAASRMIADRVLATSRTRDGSIDLARLRAWASPLPACGTCFQSRVIPCEECDGEGSSVCPTCEREEDCRDCDGTGCYSCPRCRPGKPVRDLWVTEAGLAAGVPINRNLLAQLPHVLTGRAVVWKSVCVNPDGSPYYDVLLLTGACSIEGHACTWTFGLCGLQPGTAKITTTLEVDA